MSARTYEGPLAKRVLASRKNTPPPGDSAKAVRSARMITLLLASSFEGVEIIFFAPVLVAAGFFGFLFVWFRVRGWALFCAFICILTGLFAGVCAVGMHDTFAKIADGISAIIGFALAAAFYHFKRKEKSP